jgi:hypothetical protein
MTVTMASPDDESGMAKRSHHVDSGSHEEDDPQESEQPDRVEKTVEVLPGRRSQLSVAQVRRTVIHGECLPDVTRGKACPAAATYQQDPRVRRLSSRLEVNNPVLVKASRRPGIGQVKRTPVELVYHGPSPYRLRPEGCLVVAVHQACPEAQRAERQADRKRPQHMPPTGQQGNPTRSTPAPPSRSSSGTRSSAGPATSAPCPDGARPVMDPLYDAITPGNPSMSAAGTEQSDTPAPVPRDGPTEVVMLRSRWLL